MGDVINSVTTDPVGAGGPGDDLDVLPETSLPAEALGESPVCGSSFCSHSALTWTGRWLGVCLMRAGTSRDERQDGRPQGAGS